MANQNDTHAQCGAASRSAILEEAARVAENGCLVPPDGGSPTEDERQMCEDIASRIRLLKLKGAEEIFQSPPAVSEAMIAAAVDAAWPGPEAVYDDNFGSCEAMMRAALEAALACRTPAEGERQRCMEILEDVPGETLVDRVNRLKDWHQELSNSYHDAIAEARTERDQAVSQVEEANAKKGGFAFPKIVINWDEINAMQFANSRVALMAKLDRFMSEECKDAAYWSSNHFTRSEMYVLHELLKAASPEHTSTVGGSDGAA